MARRRVRGMVTVVGGVVATLVAGLLSATPASAAAPPAVTTISISGTTIAAPGSVTIGYTATVDAPVYSAQAMYLDPRGTYRSVPLSAGASGSGDLQVVDGRANGTWRLASLALYSNAGATVVCRQDSTDASCTDHRDLSPYDVVVSGSDEDYSAPLLTGVTVSLAQVASGGQVSVSWTTQEAHGMGAISFTFENQRPEARNHRISLSSSSVDGTSGTLTRGLGTSLFNGPYHLVLVRTYDRLGNVAAFQPNGTALPMAPATGPTAHDVDFTPVVFEVSGSTRDDAPPVLTSLTSSGTPEVNKGRSITYAASDASAIRSVSVEVANPNGQKWSAVTTGTSAPAQGSVVYVPLAIGRHSVTKVVLTDANGYSIEYRRDGTTWNPLTGVTGTHDLDLASFDFTARPSAVETIAVNPRSGRMGVRWTVSGDQGRDISGYRLVVNPGGRAITVPSTGDSFASATVTGLTNGVRYTFSVAPQSAVGPGAASTVTGTPMMSDNIWAAGDADGDGRNDLFARTEDGPIWLYRSAGYPWFKAPKPGDTPAGRRVFPSAKVTSDAAYFTIDAADRLLAVRVGTDGRELGWTVNGPGWGSMRTIDGTADFTGDGKADVVAVTSTGILRIYRGDGKGRFTSPTTVGTGWSPMLRVLVPGDVTGDRKADVMAIDATGVLWIYPGNGRGGFTARKRVGSGWGGMGAVFAARDLNGDGRADLGAVTMDGKLLSYLGRGNGSFVGARTIGSGWNVFF